MMLGAEVVPEVALGEPFHGGLRADGHEYRGFDIAVRGVKDAGACPGIGTLGLKSESDAAGHSSQISGDGGAQFPQ